MSYPPEPEPTPPPAPKPPGSEDDLYDLAEKDKPSAPDDLDAGVPGGDEAGTDAWFLGLAGGRREGPFTLSAIKQRIASGAVTRSDPVWREGMSGWTPAGEVAALFPSVSGGPPGPPPMTAHGSRPETDDTAEVWRAASTDVMRRCDSIFDQPIFFRVFGRVCCVLGLFMLLVALVAAVAGKGSLFVYVFWFLLLFLVGEATAAILTRLDGGKQQEHEEEPPEAEA